MRLSRNQAVWNNCALSGSAFQHWYTCHITTKVVCKNNFNMKRSIHAHSPLFKFNFHSIITLQNTDTMLITIRPGAQRTMSNMEDTGPMMSLRAQEAVQTLKSSGMQQCFIALSMVNSLLNFPSTIFHLESRMARCQE